VPESSLISVRTQVVLDTLVGSIIETVSGRLGEPLDSEVEAALGSTSDARLARMGYLARAIEVERFERAREPMPWLAEHLERHRTDGVAWSEAAAAAAKQLAATEPSQRPEPDDDHAVSWKIPGPGGHVRYYLALRSADGDGDPRGDEARRAWLSGFLVHCLREAAAPEPR
jgi:hypothetical protein